MKYTNSLGLPPSVYNFIIATENEYDPGIGDYSPSYLTNPPYMKRLAKDKDAEIEIDVSQLLHRFFGHMIHTILKNSANDSDLKETRVYRKIGKWLIGAQLDSCLLHQGILDDYKYTTSYKFKRDFDAQFPDAPDWEAQLNIERYILKDAQVEKDKKLVKLPMPEIKELRIIGFIKDFSPTDADRDPMYPQTPVIIRDIPIWPDEKVVAYITERATLHDAAKAAKTFAEVVPCTEEEMWATKPKWALMKDGAKKAIKLYDTKEEIGEPKAGYYIQDRPGERKRCQVHKNGHSYCDCSKVCPIYQKFVEKK